MSDDLNPEETEELSKAMQEENTSSSNEEGAFSSDQVSKAHFMQLEEVAKEVGLRPENMRKAYPLKVNVEVLLGSTKMSLEGILKLQEGSVVELNKLAGEPVDITANKKLIARAEVVVVEDNFGVKILEIVGNEQRFKAAKND